MWYIEKEEIVENRTLFIVIIYNVYQFHASDEGQISLLIDDAPNQIVLQHTYQCIALYIICTLPL